MSKGISCLMFSKKNTTGYSKQTPTSDDRFRKIILRVDTHFEKNDTTHAG